MADWSACSPTRATGIIKFCELPEKAFDWQWHELSPWKVRIWVEAYWLSSRPREIDIVDAKSALQASLQETNTESTGIAIYETKTVCEH